jgi:hypothetical protein
MGRGHPRLLAVAGSCRIPHFGTRTSRFTLNRLVLFWSTVTAVYSPDPLAIAGANAQTREASLAAAYYDGRPKMSRGPGPRCSTRARRSSFLCSIRTSVPRQFR